VNAANGYGLEDEKQNAEARDGTRHRARQEAKMTIVKP